MFKMLKSCRARFGLVVSMISTPRTRIGLSIIGKPLCHGGLSWNCTRQTVTIPLGGQIGFEGSRRSFLMRD